MVRVMQKALSPPKPSLWSFCWTLKYFQSISAPNLPFQDKSYCLLSLVYADFWAKSALDYYLWFSQQPYEVGGVTSILQMRKMGYKRLFFAQPGRGRARIWPRSVWHPWALYSLGWPYTLEGIYHNASHWVFQWQGFECRGGEGARAPRAQERSVGRKFWRWCKQAAGEAPPLSLTCSQWALSMTLAPSVAQRGWCWAKLSLHGFLCRGSLFSAQSPCLHVPLPGSSPALQCGWLSSGICSWSLDQRMSSLGFAQWNTTVFSQCPAHVLPPWTPFSSFSTSKILRLSQVLLRASPLLRNSLQLFTFPLSFCRRKWFSLAGVCLLIL